MEKKQNELVAKLSDAKLAAVKQQARTKGVQKTRETGCAPRRPGIPYATVARGTTSWVEPLLYPLLGGSSNSVLSDVLIHMHNPP